MDLVISLEVSIDKQLKVLLRILEQLHKEKESAHQNLRELKQKLEYLKDSQENLNRRFSQLNLINIPSKRDILTLSKVIEENKLQNFELHHKDLLIRVKNLIKITKHFNTELKKSRGHT